MWVVIDDINLSVALPALIDASLLLSSATADPLYGFPELLLIPLIIPGLIPAPAYLQVFTEARNGRRAEVGAKPSEG